MTDTKETTQTQRIGTVHTGDNNASRVKERSANVKTFPQTLGKSAAPDWSRNSITFGKTGKCTIPTTQYLKNSQPKLLAK